VSDRFDRLPDPPIASSGVAILRRFVQALGFRLRWAADGLDDDIATFEAGNGSMSVGALMAHIAALADTIVRMLGGESVKRPPDAGFTELVAYALDRLAAADDWLAAHPDDLDSVDMLAQLCNGPVADALTHVGQLVSWRRLAGSPAPAPRLFHGHPPSGR
jgi:hypothetical protein